MFPALIWLIVLRVSLFSAYLSSCGLSICSQLESAWMGYSLEFGLMGNLLGVLFFNDFYETDILMANWITI